MFTGKIKWFNYDKGYGFIAPDQGSQDVFVHKSAVLKSKITDLTEGMHIQYEIETHNGKQSACNLQVVAG